MYNAALHAEFIRDHADYGFDVTLNKVDWGVIQRSRDEYIRRLNGLYETNLKNVGSLYQLIHAVSHFSLASS